MKANAIIKPPRLPVLSRDRGYHKPRPERTRGDVRTRNLCLEKRTLGYKMEEEC